MKIIYIFHTNSLKGGASQSGINLIKGLRELGHDILVICPPGGNLSRELQTCGFKVHEIMFTWAYPMVPRKFRDIVMFFPLLLHNKKINRAALNVSFKIAKEFKPDIIHTNTSVTKIGWELSKITGCPNVIHCREFGLRDCNALMWHVKKMLNANNQYSICIGNEVAKQRKIESNKKNIIIYNGIFHKSSSQYLAQKDSYLLYVGALYKQKGIEDLLYAYAHVPENLRRIHPLKIAGSSIEARYDRFLRKISYKLGIEKNIEWLGERRDISDLMAHATCLVVPSYNEAFGRIVAEAMFNGCLVIGRNKAGIKEQFDNGLKETGKEIGLRFNTVVELSNCLIQVCNMSASEYSEYVVRGKSTAVDMYSIECCVEKVNAFYHSITNGSL